MDRRPTNSILARAILPIADSPYSPHYRKCATLTAYTPRITAVARRIATGVHEAEDSWTYQNHSQMSEARCCCLEPARQRAHVAL
jgi:hypothetical protein